MKIKWLVDTFATVEIDSKTVALQEGEEYNVPDNSEYFNNAISRGWAEVITEKRERKPKQSTEE